jgi:hypothetical protein
MAQQERSCSILPLLLLERRQDCDPLQVLLNSKMAGELNRTTTTKIQLGGIKPAVEEPAVLDILVQGQGRSNSGAWDLKGLMSGDIRINGERAYVSSRTLVRSPREPTHDVFKKPRSFKPHDEPLEPVVGAEGRQVWVAAYLPKLAVPRLEAGSQSL